MPPLKVDLDSSQGSLVFKRVSIVYYGLIYRVLGNSLLVMIVSQNNIDRYQHISDEPLDSKTDPSSE